MIQVFGRLRPIILIFFLSFIASGCGDFSSEGSASGVALRGQTTDIVLQSELEANRAVPDYVSEVRLVGFDAQGVSLYSEIKTKAEEIRFEEVPTNIVKIHIEYITQGEVVGLAVIEVQLDPDQDFVLSDLEFQDVAASFQSLTVTPVSASIAAGTTQQYTLTGTRITGDVVDLTSSANWSVSAPDIARIDNSGLATSFKPGQVDVTATYGALTTSSSLTVTDAVAVALQVTPAQPNIPLGLEQQFTAQATFSDGTVQDVSETATWKSGSEAVAEMDGARAHSLEVGESVITAVWGEFEARATLTVREADLQSISVTPTDLSLPNGTSGALSALGSYTDGSSEDITDQVVWTSQTPATAVVNAQTGVVTGRALGTASITASLDGISGEVDVEVTAAVVDSIIVTPVDSSVAKGVSQQFTAVAEYSDQTTEDVTDLAGWSSSVPTVSSIDMTTGFAQTHQEGQVQISASFGGQTGSTNFQVLEAALTTIVVTPADSDAPKGVTVNFVATGTYTDNSMDDITASVDWSSSLPGVATIESVNPNKGRATAVTEGTTVITASLGGVSATTTFEVTAKEVTDLVITPVNPTVADGLTLPMTAVATYTDNSTLDVTTQADWSSADTSVATVGLNTGLVRGEGQGSAQLSVSFGGITEQAQVQVTDAVLQEILVTPTDASVPNGVPLQFSATGTYSNGDVEDVTDSASWTSSVSSVATVTTVGTGRGLASSHTEGASSIQASLDGKTDSVTLTVTAAELARIDVTPLEPSVVEGLTRQFTATAVFTDNSTSNVTTSADWSSGTPSVATIGLNTGLADGITPGTTTISASYGGRSDQTTLEVEEKSLQSIVVTPTSETIPNGTEQQYEAVAQYNNSTFEDITNSASWTTSNSGVATVTTVGAARGLATGHSEGTVSVTASLAGVNGNASLTISPAVVTGLQITPASATIPDGLPQNYVATATYSDLTTSNVTTQADWTTDSSAVATIGLNTGVATGEGQGTTTVRASFEGQSATAQITVQEAVLNSITVTPADSSVANGLTQQMVATGHYSNGNNANISDSVSWTSSTPTRASVSATGLVLARQVGAVTITAMRDGVSGQTSLNVTPAVLQQLNITPDSASVAAGLTTNFTVSATYSDGGTSNVTTQADWSVGSTSVATIGLHTGVARGQSAGNTSVTATFGGLQDSATLTVTPAVLQSITVTPSNPTISLGGSRQFTATANYSDNSQPNVTNSVSWVSSTPATASISPTGLASAISSGTTTISATLNGVTGTTQLTVNSPVVQSIIVTPTTPELGLGGTLAFTATAVYNFGPNEDVTNSAVWSSSAPSRATIGANTGVASAVSVGSTTISAQFGGQTGNTSLSVVTRTLSSIEVQLLPDPNRHDGETSTSNDIDRKYRAIGHYSDNTNQDISNSVTWSSTNPSAATISNSGPNKGTAVGVSDGSTDIVATLGAVSGSKSLLNRGQGGLQLGFGGSFDPVPLGIRVGETMLVTQQNPFMYDTVTHLATWTTSNPSLAEYPEPAHFRGIAPGSVTRTVTYRSYSNTSSTPYNLTPCNINSLAVTGFSEYSVGTAIEKRLSAVMVRQTGGTAFGWAIIPADIVYSSSNPGVGFFDGQGVFNAVSPGTTTVTLTFTDPLGFYPSANKTATQAVTVTP